MFSFLKNEIFGLRTQTTFVGNNCKIYLPSSLFTESPQIADIVGDKIKTIGIFWFQAEEKWYQLQLPIDIMFQFREKEEKIMKLRPKMKTDKYSIFSLKRGDAFIWDVNNKKDISQVQCFFSKLLEGAKMRESIPYSDLLQVFLNALKITEIGSLGVSSLSFEFFLSRLYRNKKNISEDFRMFYKGKENDFDYKMGRITSLTRFSSVFTSLIGEDIQSGLTNAILRTREKKKDFESPIEKIIKY